MKTVKEKLMKLLDEYLEITMTPEMLADVLVSEGVTILECGMDCKNCWKTKLVNPVQEWVSVDEPPKEDGRYLVLLEQGGMIDAKYEKRRGGFGDYHEDWTEDGLVHTWVPFKIVTHWMPLPQPPKGVQ